MYVEPDYWSELENPHEVAIWLGILRDYVEEAFKGDRRANSFIFNPLESGNFDLLCDLANIDGDYIRRKVRERFKKNKIKRVRLKRIYKF